MFLQLHLGIQSLSPALPRPKKHPHDFWGQLDATSLGTDRGHPEKMEKQRSQSLHGFGRTKILSKKSTLISLLEDFSEQQKRPQTHGMVAEHQAHPTRQRARTATKTPSPQTAHLGLLRKLKHSAAWRVDTHPPKKKQRENVQQVQSTNQPSQPNQLNKKNNKTKNKDCKQPNQPNQQNRKQNKTNNAEAQGQGAPKDHEAQDSTRQGNGASHQGQGRRADFVQGRELHAACSLHRLCRWEENCDRLR